MAELVAIFNYKDGTSDRVRTDQFNDATSLQRYLFDNPAPIRMLQTRKGGYLFDKRKPLLSLEITGGDGGGKVTEDQERPQENQEAVEPEVLPPDTAAVVYGEVANTFQSFREKFINSAARQASFMNHIVEKMSAREKLLQKATAKLEEETSRLESFVKEKVGD